MSLLEKALATPTSIQASEVNHELAELAVAWVQGLVNDLQVSKAANIGRTNVPANIGRVLKHAFAAGLITIARKEAP